MPANLEGKTALITGAGRGLGRAIASGLAGSSDAGEIAAKFGDAGHEPG